MVYREPDEERTRAATRERIGRLAREISRLDWLIGDWSTRVPDGTPAPPQALALMIQKERLETELHALVGALELMVPKGPSAFRTLLRRLLGERPK